MYFLLLLFCISLSAFAQNISIEADLLYWKANEDDLGYAIEIDDAELIAPHFEWDPGFKLGIGFAWQKWDVLFRLTHLHTHTDALLRDRLVSPLWIIPSPFLANDVKMHWRLHF